MSTDDPNLRSEILVLKHQMTGVQGQLKEQGATLKGIESTLVVLAKIETRHEHILDTMSRQQQRLDTHGEMLDGIAPRLAVLERQAKEQGKRQDNQGRTMIGLLLGLIGALATGVMALLGKGN